MTPTAPTGKIDQTPDLQPWVIVTGASRGIGQACASRLARDGYGILFTYRSRSAEAQAFVTDLKQALPGAALLAFQADVSQEAACRSAVEAGKACFGDRLWGLVNNAGINRDGLLLRMKTEDMEDVIKTDLLGPMYMIKACLPLLLRNRAGRVVNISSVSGLYGNAGQANYAAAKAGILGLTRSVAKETASRGITCNAIAPGFIQTDMTQALPEKSREAILQQIALKRFGQPDDIAAAVSFLLSADAAYITGQVLEVSGGLTM
ncbi:3-oxoacyl-ACP reductase FabG [Oscillospiraceae bacterium HV4-5-C5C]|nr:3-oxoacyl-ACP reductase FabG [Oscillospiraceae bacterium HV4-5-C5C]